MKALHLSILFAIEVIFLPTFPSSSYLSLALFSALGYTTCAQVLGISLWCESDLLPRHWNSSLSHTLENKFLFLCEETLHCCVWPPRDLRCEQYICFKQQRQTVNLLYFCSNCFRQWTLDSCIVQKIHINTCLAQEEQTSSKFAISSGKCMQ